MLLRALPRVLPRLPLRAAATSPATLRAAATSPATPRALATHLARTLATTTIGTNTGKRTPMACYQCEQTEHHTGCTTVGNCGKTPETAHLQDLLVYTLKGIAQYAARARAAGVPDAKLLESDRFIMHSLFATMTNVNFDPVRFQFAIRTAVAHRDAVRALAEAANAPRLTVTGTPATWAPLDLHSPDLLDREAVTIDVQTRRTFLSEDVLGLEELLTYGLKGTAAYATHAAELGLEDPAVFKAIGAALAWLGDNASNPKPDVNELVGLVLACGGTNLRVMEMLDSAHTTRFGHPVPTQVRTTEVFGKAILISGHDLHDLEALLQQTEGTGVNVYTHGEMLPAHGYPGLHKYKHLVGNYGGPWQLQKIEFSKFPGPIVMTTNCLIEPRESYRGRLYTRGEVGWPGVTHIGGRDFSAAIAQARAMEGFTATKEAAKAITVGFGHHTVLSVASTVLGAAKSGKLSHIFLIGGCDGAEAERSYYKKLAEGVPKDALVLTLGCGKYRFNKHDFGTLADTGIPRLLDMGQCNDAYGAIVVASALAKALGTDINSLPLSLALSWYGTVVGLRVGGGQMLCGRGIGIGASSDPTAAVTWTLLRTT